MTRKDYQAIAEMLGEAKRFEDKGYPITLETITNALSVVFRQDNPNFDKTKFVKAIEKEATR
jgi:hypothetical protein